MRFRNAVHIAMDHFSDVFKLLLYSLVTSGICFSFIYLILRAGLGEIVQSPEMQTIRDLIKNFFQALITGNSEVLGSFQTQIAEALKEFVLLLGNESSAIIGSVAGVCMIYLLLRFVLGLAQFAVADTINDRARVFSRTKFYVSYFKSIGKAALYQVIYVPLSFVYDALTLLLCWFLFFYVPSLLITHAVLSVLIALALTLTLTVCMQALKLTLISDWIPSVIAGGKTVAAGFRESMRSKKSFWRRLGTFIVSNYVLIVVNVVFSLCTFGSAFLLTFPMSIIFVLCLQFVFYYEDKGMKYFVSSRKIAGEESGGIGE